MSLGDDLDLLNHLKQHRATDLLATHIPDEEAKLLSSGKYTCLICSHRPTFETIKLLAVHRKGKKHLIELSKYLRRKHEVSSPLNLLNNKQAESRVGLVNTSLSNDLHLGPKERSTKRKSVTEIPDLKHEINYSKDIEGAVAPSAATQVRQYLRDLQKMAPLEVPKETDGALETTTKKSKKTQPEDLSNKSDWLKDEFGNWVKDPEDELDENS